MLSLDNYLHICTYICTYMYQLSEKSFALPLTPLMSPLTYVRILLVL